MMEIRRVFVDKLKMKNGMIVDTDGTKRYFKNDQLHREDGPAWI